MDLSSLDSLSDSDGIVWRPEQTVRHVTDDIFVVLFKWEKDSNVNVIYLNVFRVCN